MNFGRNIMRNNIIRNVPVGTRGISLSRGESTERYNNNLKQINDKIKMKTKLIDQCHRDIREIIEYIKNQGKIKELLLDSNECTSTYKDIIRLKYSLIDANTAIIRKLHDDIYRHNKEKDIEIGKAISFVNSNRISVTNSNNRMVTNSNNRSVTNSSIADDIDDLGFIYSISRAISSSDNDRVKSSSDNDYVKNSSGNDRVKSSSGNDRIKKSSSDDHIKNSSGDDRIGSFDSSSSCHSSDD